MTSLDFSADISAALGRIDSKLDRDEEQHQRRLLRAREIKRARIPAPVRLQGSGVCPTPTASFGIGFGGPDPGFFWTVRRVVVGGFQWGTTAAGSAELYVTGLAGLAGVIHSGTGSVASVRALNDLVDQAATLPSKGFYSNEQIIVQANESLVIVIVGGTAGQQYSASAQVNVVRSTTDLEAEFEI